MKPKPQKNSPQTLKIVTPYGFELLDLSDIFPANCIQAVELLAEWEGKDGLEFLLLAIKSMMEANYQDLISSVESGREPCYGLKIAPELSKKELARIKSIYRRVKPLMRSLGFTDQGILPYRIQAPQQPVQRHGRKTSNKATAPTAA